MLGITRRPDITFHRDGRIDITSHVAVLLGLKHGDVIDIAYDGVEYYLYKRYDSSSLVGRHEAQVRATNHGKHYCHNLRAQSVRMCRQILQMHDGADVVRLPVGELETRSGMGKVLPIIVRNNLQR